MLILLRNLVWTGISQLVLIPLILNQNVETKISPQHPRPGDISPRPSLNLSLHRNRLLYEGWKWSLPWGWTLHFHSPSLPFPDLSFPLCLARQEAASFMLCWHGLIAQWVLSSMRSPPLVGLPWDVKYLPKTQRMAYLCDCCLCQMWLKVIGGVKKFLVGTLRQGGSIDFISFAHYSCKQLVEITFLAYFGTTVWWSVSASQLRVPRGQAHGVWLHSWKGHRGFRWISSASGSAQKWGLPHCRRPREERQKSRTGNTGLSASSEFLLL